MQTHTIPKFSIFSSSVKDIRRKSYMVLGNTAHCQFSASGLFAVASFFLPPQRALGLVSGVELVSERSQKGLIPDHRGPGDLQEGMSASWPRKMDDRSIWLAWMNDLASLVVCHLAFTQQTCQAVLGKPGFLVTS
jgi:hypothetical protein